MSQPQQQQKVPSKKGEVHREKRKWIEQQQDRRNG